MAHRVALDASTPAVAQPSGRRVILQLFLVFAVCTLVALLWFAYEAPAYARKRVYIAIVGNILAGALALVAFILIERRRRRTGVDEPDEAS